MQSPAGQNAASRGIVPLVATLAAIYLVSQFLRNSVGVIAPDLAKEVGLSAAEIGLLSSAFFLSFALAQIPLGVAIDRYGPKSCMLVCAIVAFAGALQFAMATSPAGLISARVLMGLGSSCYLMAPLALYARRFPPERFTVLAGIQIAIGTVGTLFVTAPLAWASATVGWRATFIAVAVSVVVCAALVAIVVREEKAAPQAGEGETLRDSLRGVAEVTRMRWFWPMFGMHVFSYSSYVLIVGLWGGPFLTHIYGYGLTARGDTLVIPAVTHIIGVVAWGYAERLLGAYKPLVLTGAVATTVLFLLLAWVGKPEPAILALWLAAFGFATASIPVLLSHGRSFMPPHLLGRGMTLLNIGTMGGTFVVQFISGALISLFPAEGGVYPLDAYRLVFAAQAGAIVVAGAFYARGATGRP